MGGPIGSCFAGMPHGDFLAGPNVPLRMRRAVEDEARTTSNIRIAAISPRDTWLLIWLDGVMYKVLGRGV